MEVDALKQGQSDLKQQIAGLPKPPGTAEITDITRTTAAEAIEKARMKRFSLLGVNVGADGEGRLTFTGKGRYFAPFKENFAIQAEGEYMYYRDRQKASSILVSSTASTRGYRPACLPVSSTSTSGACSRAAL